MAAGTFCNFIRSRFRLLLPGLRTVLAGAFLQPAPVFFRLCGRLSGLAVPALSVPADDENRQQHHQDCGRKAEQRQPGVHKALQYRVPVDMLGQIQLFH